MAKNMRLADAMEEFEVHLASRGAKDRTVRNHMQPMRAALRVWGNIYVDNITPKHIDQLLSSVQWSPQTRNMYMSNIRGQRGFFAYCRRHGYMRKDYDPADGWMSQKVGRRERLWLPVEDFPTLLDACQTPRDRAVVAIGLFTMCRGGEVSLLKVQDVDFDRNTIDIYREKTDEYDTMPLSKELKAELLTWLNHYRERQGGELDPDWYLVPAQTGLPMRYDPMVRRLQPTGEAPHYRPTKRLGKPYEAVKRALIVMGIDPKGQGVHLLRRSSGRALFERLRSEGYDSSIKRVSAFLGHKSVTMTEHYLGLGIERQKRNELIAGEVMFPAMTEKAEVIKLRETG